MNQPAHDWPAIARAAWEARKPHGMDTGIYAPLPKRGTRAGDAPAFGLAEEAMRYRDARGQQPNMARGFVAMGFTRRLSAHARWQTPLLDADSPIRLRCLSWPVYLMARAEASPIYVCTESGEWITQTGGARGETFSSLMAFMKGLNIYQAAAALLRANGYGRVPRVCELSR